MAYRLLAFALLAVFQANCASGEEWAYEAAPLALPKASDSAPAAVSGAAQNIATVPSVSGKKAAAGLAEWTFIIFVNGRNNLENDSIKEIDWMETPGSTDKVNLVVEIGSMRTGANAIRMRVQNDKTAYKLNIPPDAEVVPNVDTGDWHEVVYFAKWAAKKYPAKRYCLMLWDHGTGWIGHAGNSNAGAEQSISYDDLTGNYIRVKEIGKALEGVSRALGKKIDLVVFEACLMQMLEVVVDVKDYADVIVGPEEVMYYYPYKSVLARLTTNPAMSAEELGMYFSMITAKMYGLNPAGNVIPKAKLEGTFSAIRSAGADGFLKKFNAMLKAVEKEKSVARNPALAAAGIVKGFAEYRDEKTTDTNRYNPKSVDIYDFVQRFVKHLPKDSQSYKAAKELLAYMDSGNFILTSNSTKQYASYAKGLAIYLPKKYYDPAYDEMTISSMTYWDDFIKWLLDPKYDAKAGRL